MNFIRAISILRLPAVVALVLAASGLDALAQAQGEKQATVRARDLEVRIQVSRPTVRAGDSINVRLTLRNLGGKQLTLAGGAAQSTVHLRVLDASGSEVKPTGSRKMGMSSYGVPLPPGAEITLTSARGKEWVNLADWGYNLRSPGTYTIVGQPAGVGPRDAADRQAPSSNEARLTIEG
jgi:hypothetical protein